VWIKGVEQFSTPWFKWWEENEFGIFVMKTMKIVILRVCFFNLDLQPLSFKWPRTDTFPNFDKLTNGRSLEYQKQEQKYT